VIVWVDDVHWGLDTLAFAAHMLKYSEEERGRLLVVCTARDEELVERTLESDLLDDLLEREQSALQLSVGPLDANECAALVEGLLGLEGELAARVEGRSGGNPLFAVRLVGELVDQGLLEVGGQGFILRQGARIELPDDIHGVWAERIERIVSGDADSDQRALELAAILGQEVNTGEWRHVCRLEDVSAHSGLVEALLENRLAVPAEGGVGVGWSFSHGMFRESVERVAKEQGRWKEHHGVCAEMLQGQKELGVEERLGRHLLAAGKGAAALEPLLVGAQNRIHAGDSRLAGSILKDAMTEMDRLNLPLEDARWGRAWVHRAQMARTQGRYDRAEEWAGRAHRAAVEHGWPLVRARGRLEQGWVCRVRGDWDEAILALEDSLSVFEANDAQQWLGSVFEQMGHVEVGRGEWDKATAYFDKGREAFRNFGDAVGTGQCLLGLAQVAVQNSQEEQAVAALERAQLFFDRSGYKWGLAQCLNGLGEIARGRGDLARAEPFYRQALANYRAIGSAGATIAYVNLGLTLMRRGYYDEAQRQLRQALDTFEGQGRRALVAYVRSALLPCAIGTGDLEGYRAHLEKTQTLLYETGYKSVDIPTHAALAGDMAREAGNLDEARLAYRLALVQWRALGREEDAREAGDRIREIDSEHA
jgi:tetratricopeptide (TPR) repeat protein